MDYLKQQGIKPRQPFVPLTEEEANECAERVAQCVVDAIAIAHRMKLLYEQMRISLEEIAGCSLDDWSLRELDDYNKLAMAWYAQFEALTPDWWRTTDALRRLS